MTDSATHPKEEKMKQLPQVLFWLGLISMVRTHFYPVRMAGLVRWASDGNGKASTSKY